MDSTLDPTSNHSLLESLPFELLGSILSYLPLSTLLLIGRVSHSLRRVLLHHSNAWVSSLHFEAEAAGILQAQVDPPINNSAFNLLAALGGLTISPPARAWVLLLPQLSRSFLLWQAELPRLQDQDWKEICEARFPPSVCRKEVLDGPLIEHRSRAQVKGKWRSVFLRTLGELEHKADSGCNLKEHLCRYLVLHRKYGLTRNRIATREFHPLLVFDELKKQNNLLDFTSVQVTIPARHCPPDVEITALVTIGLSKSTLRNEASMEILSKFGAWSGIKTHAILGPTLFTATIRQSPPSSTSSRQQLPPTPTSVELEDFLYMAERVGRARDEWQRQGCEIKDGDGYA